MFILLASCTSFHKERPDKNQHPDEVWMEPKAIPLPSGGWGAEIYADNKLYIKMDFIPVIPGKHPFQSKDDALKMARLVVEKMKTQGGLPSLDSSDLIKAGVLPQ